MRFDRIALRTTDVDAARAFYAAVLGRADAEIVALPAEAAARGAPAHWLGSLGADDVEGAVRAFVERGATRLGPTRPTGDGGHAAIVRDAGGAVVGLATPPAAPRAAAPTGVAWHVLNTPDAEGAAERYAALCGWSLGERRAVAALGGFREFAWAPGAPAVGAFADVAGRPGVHPHWLFHFPVPSLDDALAAARAGGARMLPPVTTPDGGRVAVGDDPQGAAFALREAPA